MRFLSIVLLAVTSATVAAQAPAKPPATTPVVTEPAKAGTYDLELSTDDGTITGELMLTGSERHWTAAVKAGGMEPNVQSFERKGNEYVLNGGHGEFHVMYKFIFVKDSVSGTFELSTGGRGDVRGVLKR